jgi:Prokaryotic E2 family A/Prokaryotic homologs of the JAB domain/ThiF family
MEPTFLDPGGIAVDPRSLSVPRARELADAVASGTLDFVRLVDCRCRSAESAGGEAEIIVVDLDIQRPQLIVNDIRRVERVAVVLERGDDSYPEVLALRSDFPLVPHRNLRVEEFPRSLCLYDQSWEEVRTRWTACAFIERIRQWMADTATGTLHRDDQPLEPLLFGTAYRLVIPATLVAVGGEPAEKLDIEFVPTGEHRGTLIAHKPCAPRQKGGPPQFIAAMFFADARKHGVIRHAPRNLEELADFVKGDTFDLVAELRERLKQWKDDDCLDAKLIIVIAFPLLRQEGVESEITDIWAFLTMHSVFEVGKSLGVWDRVRDKNAWRVGLLLLTSDSPCGGDIGLDVLRPHFSFSRASAARASGTEPVLCKTVAVGVGALGSQVVMNLVRSGFGCWTLIDDDDLLPHNLARHALPPWCVGSPKAHAVGAIINACFEEDTPTQAIVANILRPGEHKQPIDAALAAAELILDCAASVPVARHLARQVESPARRVSLFLNPRGSDLVCLSEDRTRAMTLDCLEMQYYRAVVGDERLSGHLETNTGRVRYARSCRDVSFTLPTHLVSMHAGIGAQAVRLAIATENASIKVWRTDPVTCAVSTLDVPVHRTHRPTAGDWTLILDDWLFKRLSELRSSKLPNETGGVLIGAYDLPSKTVYVVDTIPSPPDSEEWPTLYIRGSEGLRDRVTAITSLTAGQLEYVGEWHSHPDRCSCLPSNDDSKVFSWMTDRMSAAGLPALMAIIGQGEQSLWFLGKMERDGGWEPSETHSRT